MRVELASVRIRNAMDNLLYAHALTNMHRASDNVEYAKNALSWFDSIETEVRLARDDLQKTIEYAEFAAKGAKP